MGGTSVVATRRAIRRAHGIFCIETDWWGSLERHRSFTVRPMFELLQQMHPRLRFIHRTIATRFEFEHYLRLWAQTRHASYPILYLSMHGKPGCVYVGDGRQTSSCIGIDEIAELVAGRCRGRIVHFGSCGTMRGDRRHFTRFLKRTGASAISGYAENVGMLEPSAFEVLMLDELQQRKLDLTGIRASARRLVGLAPSLRRELGFRMVTA